MHEVKFEEAQERELRVVKKSMANIICENGQLRNYLIITSLIFYMVTAIIYYIYYVFSHI